MDWLSFAENKLLNPKLKHAFIEKVKEFQTLIASAWMSQQISTEDSSKISDLERQLEELHLEARLSTTKC